LPTFYPACVRYPGKNLGIKKDPKDPAVTEPAAAAPSEAAKKTTDKDAW